MPSLVGHDASTRRSALSLTPSDISEALPFAELDKESQSPVTPTRLTPSDADGSPSILDPAMKDNLNKSSESFIKHQHKSTPYSQATSEPRPIDPKRHDHKAAVAADLGTVISLNDGGAWAMNLYVHLVDDSKIEEFLKKTRSYNVKSKLWTAIPRKSDKNDLKEDKLYEPFVKLFNLILKRFVLGSSKKRENERKAIDTHVQNLAHQEKSPTIRWSRPDVSVKAEGPSFQKPEAKEETYHLDVGFSNMSSFMEIKVEDRHVSDKDQISQVSVYVRQIFIQQPNRRFVRVLLLTETHVRIFHFDRSGGMCSPFINIHEHPKTFVRLVVGLNWHHEAEIGLDTTIKWTIEGGKKVKGTLETRSHDRRITYQLSNIDPVVLFYDIRGHATQCWAVTDPETGVDYLVKDCWKSEDRVSEHVYLAEAQGLAGVVQMISFESNRGETKELRGAYEILHGGFHNRIAIRIVMDSYGKSVKHFESAKELVCAFRDVINGHMQLFAKDTLHRDISIDSILLGRKNDKTNPKSGYWGVLIDLHMAIKVWRDTKNISIEPRTGSRTYLSIEVLRNCQRILEVGKSIAPAQDHLDDLESFLYVYTHIILHYNEEGEEFPQSSRQISQWESNGADIACELKQSFLSKTSIPMEIRDRWPTACINLLLGFREFIFRQVELKTVVHDTVALEDRADEVSKIVAKIATHYSTILRLFNAAITLLENEEHRTLSGTLQPGQLDPGTPTPARGKKFASYSHRPLMRARQEDLDEVPKAKRTRNAA